MGFSSAARATVADGFWPVGSIAEPGGSAGDQLPGLEKDAGLEKVLHLIRRAARLTDQGSIFFVLGSGSGFGGIILSAHGNVKLEERRSSLSGLDWVIAPGFGRGDVA